MSGADRRAAHRPLHRRWVGYLVAHSAKSLVWHSSGLLFAFFLTETCGLAPRAMGATIALSLMVNAVADATIGAAWHRHERSPARLGRLQAIGAALAALFFVAFCTLPFLPVAARLAVGTLVLIAFRLSFAMLDVPQNAMVPILARDPRTRTALLAARNVCSGLASLTVVLVAVPMLLGGADRALRHLCWAGALGCAVALSAFMLARSRWLRHAAPTVAGEGLAGRVPMPLVLALTGLVVAASTLFRSLEPYAAAYGGFGRGILLWAAIGAIACQPVWLLAGRRLSPDRCAALAGCVALVGAAALADPLRAGGTGNVLGGLGFGIGSGGLWLMLWTMAVRHDALRRTARLTAVSKAAQAVAALSLGQMLHGTGYRVAPGDPSSLPRLAMVGTLLVLALCGFALALREWRVSRTARGAGPATRRRAVPQGPVPVPRPPAGSSAPGPRAVPAE